MAAIGAIGGEVSSNKLRTSGHFIANNNSNNSKKFHIDNLCNYVAGTMTPPKSCTI